MPTDPAPPPLRPWREISRELTKESNRDRIITLHHELNRGPGGAVISESLRFKEVTAEASWCFSAVH
jgi:hypothetical protein